MSQYALKPIQAQIACLQAHFPQLRIKQAPKIDLPDRFDGLAIPVWERIADSYHSAVRQVIDLIKRSLEERHPRGYHAIVPENLEQDELSARFYRHLAEQQQGNILVISGEFKISHPLLQRQKENGDTARLVRPGSFANAILVLTHLDQMPQYQDFLIDSAGDRLTLPSEDQRNLRTPLLSLFRNITGPDPFWFEFADGYWASSTVAA